VSDIVDRANTEADAWTAERIRQITRTLTPNDVTECIDCGEDIEPQRKKALPWAVRCTRCQTKLEGKK
jgi:RNA polymerase-binding transcription factor DksA